MIQKKNLGIYVHIPFCARKCAYCDFVSGVASAGEIAYYIRVLLQEIRGYEILGNRYRVDTIFFGGGTPSLMDPMNLKRILNQIRNQFLLTPDPEITVECNPGTLTAEKLAAYRAMGVNRLSIGLQSAHNGELELLGRIHTWEQFLETYRLAREAGFDNINIDLMSGLPGQTMEDWTDTLEKVTALNPEHISAYSLIIEEGTPFFERYGTPEGEKLLPDEETDRAMYHHTAAFLKAKGYDRYEISNYAKPGRECRHNITYWTGGDYLGVGLNAASYLGGCRFSNPAKYIDYWDYGPEACRHFRNMLPQSTRSTVEEFMFLGLRMMRGISTEEFYRRFGVPFEEVYGPVLEKYRKLGLLEQEGPWIRLTEAGIDVSNTVMADFLLDEDTGNPGDAGDTER